MLRVSRVPSGDPSTAAVEGRSRLECLTCPYQHILTKQLYERKEITPKLPDDALGGEGAWDNVDKTNGACRNHDGVMMRW
jgi:DNA-directed RNA polymerase III subunit RPC11